MGEKNKNQKNKYLFQAPYFFQQNHPDKQRAAMISKMALVPSRENFFYLRYHFNTNNKN